MPILDDTSSRPGSVVSLLRTTIGLYMRECGGWMPTMTFTELMGVLDVPVELARTGLTRLKQKGVLAAEIRDGQRGYALTEAAEEMFARGDRRIDHPRSMGPDDPWCLISFSLPESQRSLRHQLRRHLSWIGCGTVTPGLWVCPGFLKEEVVLILRELGLEGYSVLFTTHTPEVTGDLRETVSQWWDLDSLADLHREFIAEQGGVELPAGETATAGAETFAAYVRAVDRWRVIPYVDPGLPAECLPADWPGEQCIALFQAIRRSHEAPSLEFVRSLLPAEDLAGAL